MHEPILPTKHGKRDNMSPGSLGGGGLSRLPCFVGRIGACACSGYQALFPPPPREPGDKASLVLVCDCVCVRDTISIIY